MRRIVILGCSGSGKTTLAVRLGERLGLPVVHLDPLYWEPGWRAPDAAAFLARVADAIAGDAWVSEGNYRETFELRLPRADGSSSSHARGGCSCGACCGARCSSAGAAPIYRRAAPSTSIGRSSNSSGGSNGSPGRASRRRVSRTGPISLSPGCAESAKSRRSWLACRRRGNEAEELVHRRRIGPAQHRHELALGVDPSHVAARARGVIAAVRRARIAPAACVEPP